MPILQLTKSTANPSKSGSRKSSTQVMVDNALKSLNDFNGSSLAAVNKFIAGTYNIDMDATSRRIKKYVKESLNNGKFIKTTGKGIAGSFKISPKFKEAPKQKIKFKYPKPKKYLSEVKLSQDVAGETKKTTIVIVE